MTAPAPGKLTALALPCALAAALALLLGWVGLQAVAFTDYEVEAEPALQALRDGSVAEFLALLPAYGGSLVLRAPFALAPDLWGGEDLALFRSVALPCLVAGAWLGVVLWRRTEALGAGRRAALVALALCAANPLALRAMEIGHPEELLGAVLCVAAVLCAGAGRPVLAGALVGLAVANKPWAIIAVAPVVLTLPAGRSRALAAAAGTAAAVLAPLWLLGSSAIAQSGAAARDAGAIFQPWQVWWFLGEHGQQISGLLGEKPGYRAAPGWVGQVARPLVVLVPLALCLALATRIRNRPWTDGLLLLALVLLLRCLIDPWNVVYYELPFVLALLAWEVHARPGVPAISVTVTLLCWVTLEQLPDVLSADLQAGAFLLWSVPLAFALLAHLMRPLPAREAARRSGRDLQVADRAGSAAGGRVKAHRMTVRDRREHVEAGGRAGVGVGE